MGWCSLAVLHNSSLMEDALACRGEEEVEELTVELEQDRAESLEIANRTLVGKILSGRLLNRGRLEQSFQRLGGNQKACKLMM